jgi:hypothetical protein
MRDAHVSLCSDVPSGAAPHRPLSLGHSSSMAEDAVTVPPFPVHGILPKVRPLIPGLLGPSSIHPDATLSCNTHCGAPCGWGNRRRLRRPRSWSTTRRMMGGAWWWPSWTRAWTREPRASKSPAMARLVRTSLARHHWLASWTVMREMRASVVGRRVSPPLHRPPPFRPPPSNALC